MRRGAFPLATALLLAFAGVPASAARTVTHVGGDVRALAFSGDALVVARQPAGKGLRFERLEAGAATRILLATSLRDDDDSFALAASPEALAIALSPDSARPVSRVLVGSALGPLREVASCSAGLLASPVAASGTRIGWREGGCGEPVDEPRGIGPSAIVVAGADPAARVRRTPVAGSALPISLVLLPGDRGLVGTLLPSFFGVDGDVREFSPAGIGATVAAERSHLLSPAGILADGTRVLVRESAGDDDSDEDECADAGVFALAPGSTERRTIPTGGCLVSGGSIGPLTGTGPVATASRIVALIEEPVRERGESKSAAVVSVRGDGSDRRVLARGTYRRPRGVAADGERVAWWQTRCSGGSEIVVSDLQGAGSPTVASCRLEVLTRSARVRAGRITLRLRCPIGCSGGVFGGRYVVSLSHFAFGPGTHKLSVPLRLGKLRSARVRLDVAVDQGPGRTATIRVRR